MRQNMQFLFGVEGKFKLSDSSLNKFTRVIPGKMGLNLFNCFCFNIYILLLFTDRNVS